MPDSKPWFLVMSAADANKPGSEWNRAGAASYGKVSVRPIAPEGWAALGIFIVIGTMIPLLIWGLGFAGGSLSLTTALVATVIFEVAVVGAFVLLIWLKSTRLEA